MTRKRIFASVICLLLYARLVNSAALWLFGAITTNLELIVAGASRDILIALPAGMLFFRPALGTQRPGAAAFYAAATILVQAASHLLSVWLCYQITLWVLLPFWLTRRIWGRGPVGLRLRDGWKLGVFTAVCALGDVLFYGAPIAGIYPFVIVGYVLLAALWASGGRPIEEEKIAPRRPGGGGRDGKRGAGT